MQAAPPSPFSALSPAPRGWMPGVEVPPLVVTKVAKAEDLANLMWWQQGDEAMYTADNLKARARNRSHPDVLAILDVWWQAATNGSKKASVLPEPVLEIARTSRPLSARGQLAPWMAVGSVKRESSS